MNLGFASLAQPEMKITEIEADPRDLRVFIAARKDGIIAAILNMMGITGTTSFKGDGDGCTIEQSSFTGQSRTYISWGNVSTCFHSVTRAMHYLGVAFPLFFVGIGLFLGRDSSPAAGAVMLGLSAALAVLAFLKRSVVVGVLTSGGSVHSLKLKGSASELEELKAAMNVVEMLNRAVSEGSSAMRHESIAITQSATAAARSQPPAAEHKIATCPSCQARMKVPVGREGHAMRCPKCSQSFAA